MGRFQLALPDDDDAPAQSSERGLIASIPLDVAIEFLSPIVAARLRHGGAPATGVPMPEAPVDENSGAPRREAEVRPARQPVVVQHVAEAETMQRGTHNHLCAGIGAANARHDGASLGRRGLLDHLL